MFTPLARLPQRTQHRTHGAGLPVESPEQELAQDRIPAPTGSIASCITCSKRGITLTSNLTGFSLRKHN